MSRPVRHVNPKQADQQRRKKLLRSTALVGLWTLFSRLLGMLRDVVTAAVFGMSAGGIMDTFVVAFRLPDMARKLFGDGSLGISFIPVFTKTLQKDPQKAWVLLSAVLTWVFLGLSILVALGEYCCWIGFTYFPPESRVYLISHLLALLLPYLILISMTAITAAALQVLGRFSIAALIPPILNITWLLGLLFLAPAFSSDPTLQCYILALCILCAGILQFFAAFPILWANGYQYHLPFGKMTGELRRIFYGFLPQFFGLMTVQLNLMNASVLAWLFAGSPDRTITWLGNLVRYPLLPGSTSSIYYSERLFEFPQGLIGMAVATVIYPLLSRHATAKNFKAFGEDLTLGIRLVSAFSIPAGFGLMLLSERLAHLLFQRGAFTASDTFRTADMIFWFGIGVWPFCLLPVIIRSFYVVGDIRTPFRAGVIGGVANILLCFVLMWPMREEGLALSISLSAALQSTLLFWLFCAKHGHVHFKSIVQCIARCSAATFVMCLAVAVVMKALPGNDSLADIYHIVLGGIVGIFVYFTLLRALGGRELGILFRGRLSKPRYRRTRRPR